MSTHLKVTAVLFCATVVLVGCSIQRDEASAQQNGVQAQGDEGLKLEFSLGHLTEFRFEEIIGQQGPQIEDPATLEYLWKNIWANNSSTAERYLSGGQTFPVSKQNSRQNLNEFTILHLGDCDNGVWYVITDHEWRFISSHLVTYFGECADVKLDHYSWFINDSTLITLDQQGSIVAEEHVTTTIIQSNGQLHQDAVLYKPTTCLTEKLSVRDAPKEAAKELTVLKLGDAFKAIADPDESSVKEENGHINIELPDGTQGWVQARAIGTLPAVAKHNLSLFENLDTETRTEKLFRKFQVFGISDYIQDEENWIEVAGIPDGESEISSGWLLDDQTTYSTNTIDIKAARIIPAEAAQGKKDAIQAALTQLRNNSELNNSSLIEDLELGLVRAYRFVETSFAFGRAELVFENTSGE